MPVRMSATIDRTGHCDNGFHERCPGGLRLPADGYWYCGCNCHDGQERKPPETKVLIEQAAQLPAGAYAALPRKKSDEMRDWAAELVVKGVLQFEAPSDEKARKALHNRMHVVGKRAGVPYSVSSKGGKVTIRVKESS